MNSALKFMSGVLLGSALGLMAGLLIAPTTGKQARKKIGKKSKKLAKRLAGYMGMEEKLQGTPARRKTGKTPVEA